MNQISTEMISSEILACEEPQNSEPEKQVSPKNKLIVPKQDRKPEESHTTALSNENSVTHE